MNLKEVIFTDGKIVRIEQSSALVVIDFCDYERDLIRIVLSGDVVVELNDAVGVDFADSKLVSNSGRTSLQLFNDEGSCVFRAEFDEGHYTYERSKT